MNVRAEIDKLKRQWQAGTAEGPDWPDLMLELAARIRDEAMAICKARGKDELAADIRRRIRL